MDLGLNDATVVVSGGTKGMGRAAAECFAGEGARVAVLARTRPAMEDTVNAMWAAGSTDAIGIETDLTLASSVRASFDEVADRWGRLNVLVNAAGPVEVGIGGFDDLDDDEWMDTFDIGTLERGAVHPGRSPDAPTSRPDERRMGPHRERVGAFDQTPVARHRRLHRVESGADEPEQEPVAVARTRRHPGEHGVARLVQLPGHA